MKHRNKIKRELNQIASSDHKNSVETVGDRLVRKSLDAIETGRGVTVSPKLMLLILEEFGIGD